MTKRLPLATIVLSTALAGTAVPARPALNVVATTSSMGMLARAGGGDAVKVTVLSPPDRDAHYLLARPGMNGGAAPGRPARRGRGGAGGRLAARRPARRLQLEDPARAGRLLRGSGPGRPPREGAGGQSGPGRRAPDANPHYYMDPERMARVATALAGRLATMDPAHAADFTQWAAAFAAAVAERVPRWKEEAAGAAGVVAYHKDVNCLTELLGVPILGYVEPPPGIPPTASHLQDLVQGLKGKKGIVLNNSFESADGPDFLAKSLGWKTRKLQLEVDLDADGASYLDHIGEWVTAVASAK